MSVCLSLQNNCRWKTFLTHTKRERFMIGTVIFYFIWYVSFSCTILAFLIRKMLVFAFLSLFINIVIKTLMLYEFFIFFLFCTPVFLFFFSSMNHFHFFVFWFLLYFFNNSSETIFFFIFNYCFRSFDSSSIWIFQNNIFLWFFFVIFFILFDGLKLFWRRWKLC